MRESQVRYFGVRKIRQRFGWKTKNVYRLSACLTVPFPENWRSEKKEKCRKRRLKIRNCRR